MKKWQRNGQKRAAKVRRLLKRRAEGTHKIAYAGCVRSRRGRWYPDYEALRWQQAHTKKRQQNAGPNRAARKALRRYGPTMGRTGR